MSFARAADGLAVTPTAISHQIRLLEEITGQSLFRRRPRPITLTDAGEQLFPVLRDGLDRFAAAVAGLRADADNSPLIVSTTTAFASRWLLPRLAKLKEDIDLGLEIDASETSANLRSGTADFSVRYRRTPIPDLECHELARDRFIPVMNPSLLASGPPVNALSDLAAHTLVHFRWKRPDLDPPTWERFVSEMRGNGEDVGSIDPAKGIRFSEEPHAIEAVLAGQGVGLVSDVLVQRELSEGRLVQPLDVSIDGLAFFVAYLAEAPRRKSIETFLLWARDEVAYDRDSAIVEA